MVGVDPSLTDTGITVLAAETGKHVRSCSIKTKASPVDHHRIDYVVEQFFDFLSPYMTDSILKHKRIAFMWEDIVFASKGKASARYMATGVCQWNIRQQGLAQSAMTPGAWASIILNPFKVPRASDDKKKAVQKRLGEQYGFHSENLNVTDSYGIAQVGLLYFSRGMAMSARALT